MSPRTKEQLETIRKDRRQAIMDTALEEFASYGYESTSISMIAKKAGVSKGLMYNYFESKEALLKTIMSEGIDEIFAFIDPNHDGVITKDEFIYLIDEIFALMKEKSSFYKLYFALIMQPAVSKLFIEKINEVFAPMIRMFVDYYEKKGSKNPFAEAILIGALFDGIGFNYLFNEDQYPLDEVIKLVKERFV
jgi:AcrR family transcriptional regulator